MRRRTGIWHRPIRQRPRNLAAAITSALSDRNHYLRLRANAIVRAREFSLSRHMDSLLTIFEQLVRPACTPQAAKVAAR